MAANYKTYSAMNEADDEYYTRLPDALAMFESVQRHISLRNKIVWMPFGDDGKNIEKAAHSLKIYKTVSGGVFPDNEPKEWDIMISNPPFSGRTKMFEQIFAYDKPFVLLQPVQALNNNSMIRMLCDRNNDIGVLCPDNRMGYIVNGEENTHNTSFYSMWLCYKIPSIRGFVRL